jgi:hypothetical protein
MVVYRKAQWELWTDNEMMFLDESFTPIGPDIAHGLGVNRWMPISLSAVSLPGFWAGDEGEDLTAATKAIWLAGILLIKETGSATKQTFLQGDTSTAASGQPVDTSTMMSIPEGVSATTVDMSMDTGVFISAADHILERVANSYGMSLAQVKNQGIQSAEAREAMLEPLRARRREQIKYARRWEKQLAIRMSRVGKASNVPELSFDVVAWSQDFGEIQAITPFKQRMEEHIQARQIGIDNRVRFAMRENPDLTAEQALEFIGSNFAIETEIVGLMKELMAISGGRAPTAGVAVNTHDGATDAIGNDPQQHQEPVSQAA